MKQKVNYSTEIRKNKKLFNEWLAEWLALWPTHMLSGGYRVSGNTMECKKRMGRFLRNFPSFDKELIMQATKNYLENQEQQGWAYTKKNSKFIFDSETSVLEQECNALLSGEDTAPQSNTFDL